MIVTSYVFKNGAISFENLNKLVAAVGKGERSDGRVVAVVWQGSDGVVGSRLVVGPHAGREGEGEGGGG